MNWEKIHGGTWFSHVTAPLPPPISLDPRTKKMGGNRGGKGPHPAIWLPLVSPASLTLVGEGVPGGRRAESTSKLIRRQETIGKLSGRCYVRTKILSIYCCRFLCVFKWHRLILPTRGIYEGPSFMSSARVRTVQVEMVEIQLPPAKANEGDVLSPHTSHRNGGSGAIPRADWNPESMSPPERSVPMALRLLPTAATGFSTQTRRGNWASCLGSSNPWEEVRSSFGDPRGQPSCT